MRALSYYLTLSKRSPVVDRVTTPLIAVLGGLTEYIFNVGLLGLPLYLESQGYVFLEEAERYKAQDEDFQKVLAVLPTGKETTANDEANGHRRDINTSSLSSTTSFRSYPASESVKVLAHTWSQYVERRGIEWTYCFLPISLAVAG